MSKRMTTDELKRHIADALGELDELLNSWLYSSNEIDQKRAQIMSYWIKTYTGMIRRENEFNPASLPRLARRQIVNVDFGFRVGSELGGLHYAVVLDKANSVNGDTVTVIPLGSLKERHKASRNKIILEDGIFAALDEKAQNQVDEARKLMDSVATDPALKSIGNSKTAGACQITVTSRDAEGHVLDVSNDYTGRIAGNDTIRFSGGVMYVGDVPSAVELAVGNPMGGYNDHFDATAKASDFQFKNVARLDESKISGDVVNNSSVDCTNVRVRDGSDDRIYETLRHGEEQTGKLRGQHQKDGKAQTRQCCQYQSDRNRQ